MRKKTYIIVLACLAASFSLCATKTVDLKFRVYNSRGVNFVDNRLYKMEIYRNAETGVQAWNNYDAGGWSFAPGYTTFNNSLRFNQALDSTYWSNLTWKIFIYQSQTTNLLHSFTGTYSWYELSESVTYYMEYDLVSSNNLLAPSLPISSIYSPQLRREFSLSSAPWTNQPPTPELYYYDGTTGWTAKVIFEDSAKPPAVPYGPFGFWNYTTASDAGQQQYMDGSSSPAWYWSGPTWREITGSDPMSNYYSTTYIMPSSYQLTSSNADSSGLSAVWSQQAESDRQALAHYAAVEAGLVEISLDVDLIPGAISNAADRIVSAVSSSSTSSDVTVAAISNLLNNPVVTLPGPTTNPIVVFDSYSTNFNDPLSAISNGWNDIIDARSGMLDQSNEYATVLGYIAPLAQVIADMSSRAPIYLGMYPTNSPGGGLQPLYTPDIFTSVMDLIRGLFTIFWLIWFLFGALTILGRIAPS